MRSSDAVAALVADEERRDAMGKHARAIAVERYSWPRIARRLVEIYEQVTGVEAEARAA